MRLESTVAPEGRVMSNPSNWAAILAGGDGRRLQVFTRLVAGDERPKQFCRLIGSRSLLAETTARVCQYVEPDRVLYVLNRQHDRYYRDELRDVRRTTLIEQPSNRGTSAAIAYTLCRMRGASAHAAIGFFPADHHFQNTTALRRTIAMAYGLAESHPDRLMLVGARSERAETEYGWIEPGPILEARRFGGAPSARSVVRFHETPSSDLAVQLFHRRCYWNTFILVGRRAAFEQLLAELLPDSWKQFEPIRQARSAAEEAEIAEALFATLPHSDFSRDVLSVRPERLAVVSLLDSGWTDLGQPGRVLELMSHGGRPAPRLRLVAS
jgi:mannose-1-phosphate guanylyltransferase